MLTNRFELYSRHTLPGSKRQMLIESASIDNLSNKSYLIGSEKLRQCVVIYPVRDHYTNLSSSRGVRNSYALEAHVHNDFNSGARELGQGRHR